MSSPNTGTLKTLQQLVVDTEGLSNTFLFEFKSVKYVCSIKKHRKKRSIPQNRLYWLWIKAIEDHTGNHKDTIHELLKRKFLKWEVKKIEGLGTYHIPGSTKNLDTKGFTEYLDKIQLWANNFFGYRLPQPGDVGWDEFYETYGI